MKRRAFLPVLILTGCPAVGMDGPLIGDGAGSSKPTVAVHKTVCPRGMNEDSSAAAQQECKASLGVDVKDQTGGVTGRCFANGNTVVKCTVPPECKYGFHIEGATPDFPGTIACESPPAPVISPPPPPPPPPPADRCAKHEIRDQATYKTCLRNCEINRQNAYDKCTNDGCKGGVNNAKPGCEAACAGKMLAARNDNCCPGCE